MKKVFLLILTSFVFTFVYAKGEFVTTYTLSCNDSIMKDMITVDYLHLSQYDTTISFRNHSEDRVFIEWRNAMYHYQTVKFADYDKPKDEEVIYPNSSSLMRYIVGRGEVSNALSYLSGNGTTYNYIPKKVKKGEDAIRTLQLPIRFSDGKVVLYEITITIHYKK